MIRRVLTVGAGLAVVCLLIGGGFLAWLHASYTRPGPLQADAVVIIPKGAGVSGVASTLQNAKIITDHRAFVLAVRLWGGDRPLRAGEFAIPAAASARDVVAILREGKTVVRRLTIAEGLTSQEILARLSDVDGLVGDLPDEIDEGVLLPETYHFSYGDSRQGLLRRMRDDMDRVVAALWPGRDPAVPLTRPEEAVILASIVEKETGVAIERPRVAAVFINRLRKGMRLQSDPTVVYGVTEGRGPLGRSLTRADLNGVTPYNTYQIKGLPPTPIANPGKASIAAVLHPAETDDLYFVADGTGGHVFAKTLRDHNRNVAKWRKLVREKRKANDDSGGQASSN